MREKPPILSDEQIREIKYLEIADSPEYRGGDKWTRLDAIERRQVEDRAIARAQWEADIKWLCEETEKVENPYDETDEADGRKLLILEVKYQNEEGWLHVGFEAGRQKILALLQGDDE